MDFPFSEIPRTQTPPSSTACQTELQLHPVSATALGSQIQPISDQDLTNMEHQFLYYPLDLQDYLFVFDTSAASYTGSSLSIPAGHQQPLPLIISTPPGPSSLAQDTFSLGPTFQYKHEVEGNWQFAMPNLDQMPVAMWSDDFSKHRGISESSPFMPSVQCSPAPSSFSLGTPLLAPADSSSQGLTGPPTGVSESGKAPNARKRAPSHIRLSFLSLRSSSPLSRAVSSAESPSPNTISHAQGPGSSINDQSKWYTEFIRVSKELQALHKQFAGIADENCELKLQNQTLKSDLAWALGLNHMLPKIQNYIRSAKIDVGGGILRAPHEAAHPTYQAPLVFPPMPAPMPPARQEYIYDNLEVAKTAFPHVAAARGATSNHSYKPAKDYRLPVVQRQSHLQSSNQLHVPANTTTTTTTDWSSAYATTLSTPMQMPVKRQTPPVSCSSNKRTRLNTQ